MVVATVRKLILLIARLRHHRLCRSLQARVPTAASPRLEAAPAVHSLLTVHQPQKRASRLSSHLSSTPRPPPPPTVSLVLFVSSGSDPALRRAAVAASPPLASAESRHHQPATSGGVAAGSAVVLAPLQEALSEAVAEVEAEAKVEELAEAVEAAEAAEEAAEAAEEAKQEEATVVQYAELRLRKKCDLSYPTSAISTPLSNLHP